MIRCARYDGTKNLFIFLITETLIILRRRYYAYIAGSSLLRWRIATHVASAFCVTTSGERAWRYARITAIGDYVCVCVFWPIGKERTAIGSFPIETQTQLPIASVIRALRGLICSAVREEAFNNFRIDTACFTRERLFAPRATALPFVSFTAILPISISARTESPDHPRLPETCLSKGDENFGAIVS